MDFVYKQRADHDKKWALRNAKLRMSRKLIFAAGLTHVFFCHLDPDAAQARSALKTEQDVSLLTAYLSDQLAMPPLETVARACNQLSISNAVARKIFDNYDRFLGILDDKNKRDELAKAATHPDLRDSGAWREIRDVSAPFHEGLVELFLGSNDELKSLTTKYGVF